MLVAAGNLDIELVRQIGVEFDVAGKTVTRNIDRGGWREAGEHLRPRCRTVAEEERPGDVAAQFAGADLVVLVAPFTADRERGLADTDIDRTLRIEVDRGLARAQPARVEFGRADIAAERSVPGVGDEVVEPVGAVADRQVEIPAAGFSPHAQRGGNVLDVAVDQRQEAIGIERHAAVGEVGVAGIESAAIEPGPVALALAVAAESIDFERVAKVGPGVEEQVEVFRLAVAEAVGIAVEGRLARIADPGIVAPDVRPRAVGRVAVLILCSQVDIGAVADRQAEVGGDGDRFPVTPLAVVAGKGDHRVVTRARGRGDARDLVNVFHRGDVLAERHLGAAALPLLQLDVDHPGDGIGAILRGCAVAQHFDPVDRQRGDGVHVDPGRTAPDRPVEVEQRGNVTALAVDQHQHLVRCETAQGRRAQRVGPVGQRGLGKVERRHQVVEQAVGFGDALVEQRIAADHVDRYGAVGHGTVGPAGAGHDDQRLVATR